jgi:hypothetical protein
MTFSSKGYAEWHSYATYKNKEQFSKLFMTYVMEHKHSELDHLDPNKHLI